LKSSSFDFDVFSDKLHFSNISLNYYNIKRRKYYFPKRFNEKFIQHISWLAPPNRKVARFLFWRKSILYEKLKR